MKKSVLLLFIFFIFFALILIVLLAIRARIVFISNVKTIHRASHAQRFKTRHLTFIPAPH